METSTEAASDPGHLAVQIVRKGRLLIAIPREKIEPLTEEMVCSARDAVRERSK
jgi:hypothetical protein